MTKTNNTDSDDKPDPTYLIIKGYQTEHQTFWSGFKWVSDPSDACEYAWGAACVALKRALTKLTDRPSVIALVENYGYVSEHAAESVEAS